MELTKKLEAEILKVYNTYWDAVLKGDIPSKAAFMDDNIQIIGSAEDEVFLNKKDAVKFYNATSGQVADKVELRNRKIVTTPIDDLIFINETCDMYVLIEKKWVFYSKFRLTSLLQNIKKNWKFVHVHASIPDSKTEEGEQLALKKIKKENLELRQAVKRRTTELEQKNRELEIEAALERVRSAAMSMRKPDDLLNICEILFNELLNLGFDELRNAMINIHNDINKTFLNYDYSDKIGKSITLLDYNAHPVMEKQIMQSRLTNDAFSEAIYEGKDLEEWKKFRKKYGEKDDPRIKKIKALYYYFYSTGNGTIGISTFSPIGNEKLLLLKRFRNVFSLAYQRYSDIAVAEAQAREAEIQLALERVRARTMAMYNSDELAETAGVLFQQLVKLGITPKRCFIGIIDKDKKSENIYLTSSEGKVIPGTDSVPMMDQKYLKDVYYAWKNKKEHLSYILKGQQRVDWTTYIMNKAKLSLPEYTPDKLNLKQLQNEPAVFNYLFFSSGYIGLHTVENLSETEISMLKRFAAVFEQTYTRFLDLKKAEAQARESEIQLALERVRARTMAMQKSDELLDAASLLFHQVKELGCEAFSCGFVLLDKNKSDGEFFMSAEGKFQPSVFIPNGDESAERNMYLNWVKGAKLYTEDAEGEELVKYFEYLMSIPGKTGEMFRAMKKAGIQFPQWQRWHAAYFSQGYLLFITKEPFEETGLFPRFASVFEQTYTRFLDLQKAEEQTKEAQIQTSLERVRASAMAMHKSEELLDVCEKMFKEFLSLGFDEMRNAIINIHNDADNSFINYDYAEAAGKSVNRFTNDVLPFVSKMMKISHSSNDAFSETHISGKTLTKFRDLRRQTGQKDEPRLNKSKSLYFYFYSIGIGAIGISTYGPINNEKKALLKRFRDVFNLSYKRYIDISKAEAQAREAEIQLALERVRARTMAMQRSEELKEVIQLVYEQFIHLNIHIEHTGFILDYKERDDLHIWLADQREIPSEITIPCFDSLPNNSIRNAKEKGKDFFKYLLTFEEKNKFYRELFKFIQGVPEESLEYYFNCPGLAGAGVLLENIGLYIENFSGTPYTDEENNMLMRFGRVFQQTYTRFLDLKKAEEQAREAQIEAALERVRARSMGMHKSNELKDVVRLLYKEFRILLTNIDSVNIQLNPDSSKDIHLWASVEEDIYPELYHVPYIDLPIFEKFYNAFNSPGDGFFDHLLNKEEKDAFFSEVFKVMPVPSKRKKMIQNAEGMVMVGWFHKHSGIDIVHYNLKRFSEEEKDIVKRFAATFEQTYIRFLDLQKAEAQTREAEIQLALERVRARTMAMHKSSELAETAAILFQQMTELGVTPERINICLIKEEEKILEVWATDQQGVKISHHFYASLNEPTTGKRVYDAWKEKKKSIVIDLSGKELNDWLRYVREIMGMTIKAELVREHRIHSVAFFSQGMILTTTPEPLPKESIKLLERFADVFNLTYRRFLDLQKAEAQAREAQIEAALERVRSLALGMRKSEEVGNITDSFFSEFNKLSVNIIGCSIVVIDEDKNTMELWRARSNVAVKPFESSSFNKSMNILKKYLPQWFPRFYSALGERKNHLIEEMSSNTRLQFINSIAEQYNYSEKEKSKLFEVTPEKINAHFLFFKLGYLALIAEEKLPGENLAVARRFIEAFAFAYTRFLDIKKAEAQAREAQIEAALEKVRSRSLAMHSTNELGDVVTVIVEKLKDLGVVLDANGVVLCTYFPDSKDVLHWIVSPDFSFTGSYLLPYFDHPIFNDAWQSKESGDEYFSKAYTVEEKNSFFEYAFEYSDYKLFPDEFKQWVFQNDKHILSFAWQKNSAILIPSHTGVVPSEDDIVILKRFAKVFEQSYVRFLDLQKAEIQAREAQIEAALERVRSRTMGMQRSDELQDAAIVLFQQVEALGVSAFASGFNIWDDDRKEATAWMVGKDRIQPPFKTSSSEDIFFRIYEAAERGESIFVEEQEGKALEAHYAYMISIPVFKEIADKMAKAGQSFPSFQIIHCAFFSHGYLMFISFEPVPSYYDIFKRFAKVFEQTYTRFLDLQKAEAQAREAVKQASLDRVRGKIASMRTTEDLNRITPIIWNELKTLEVPFIRCGVFIIDEEQATTRVYLTTPDGKSLGVLNLSFDANDLTSNTVENWRVKKIYREHWDRQGFINWTKSMMELGQVQNAETYQGSSTPPESLYLHFIPFTQGMLYVGDVSPLTDEKLDLVKTLAEAFSIAYARYEDFKSLEEAKNKIEITLNELKSAQAQLIHSEKLASLGELTAGIAHEIKNPLNFVNNFSELSKELLDEIKAELDNNNKEEILAILEDMKLNLEKINEHGKRADSIVKGMLLHSRGSSGEKTLTDINDLLDQYVNLAYHGMRAQNKEFNITIEKDYDESLEKINVVPQDISRVFLNIINNACYAAYDRKKKSSGNNFYPTLKVSTKQVNGKVEIRIGDNGNGIPKEILDKIFQPFFTTKPTGEGTGLGLSLSYDIVTKVHGGELNVETKEGKGTEFIIKIPVKTQ